MAGRRRKATSSRGTKPKRGCPEAAAVEPAEPEKTEEEKTVDMLTECSEKQKSYIDLATEVLRIWDERCPRLEFYQNYIRDREIRDANINMIQGFITNVLKEFNTLETHEQSVLASIRAMEDQDKRLIRVFDRSCAYQNIIPSPPLNEPRAGVRLPNEKDISRQISLLPDVRTLSVFNETLAYFPPTLSDADLEKIDWPLQIEGYDKYPFSAHRHLEIGEECNRLNDEVCRLQGEVAGRTTSYQMFLEYRDSIPGFAENRGEMIDLVLKQRNKINTLYNRWKNSVRRFHTKKAIFATFKDEEKRLSSRQKSRDDYIEAIRKDVNQELFKCGICLQMMTNGEKSVRCPQLFSSCGHYVCAQCMKKFKDADNTWKCPECRVVSTQVVTNWGMMKMIDPEWEKNRIQLSL